MNTATPAQELANEIGALLRNAFENQDEPIALTDNGILDLAYAACEEMRRRMPRYALDQGDLDDDQAPLVARAEEALEAVETLRSAWLTA